MNHNYLVIDFSGLQIAFTRHITGSAKFTSQGAAHLRGYAGSHPVIGRDEHPLNEVTIKEAESKLDGAVITQLLLGYLNAPNFKMRRQQRPSFERKVGHFIKLAGRLFPEPFINLFGPKGFFAVFVQKLAEGLKAQFSNIRFGLNLGTHTLQLLPGYRGY